MWDWQTIVALALVAAAGLWIGARILRTVSRTLRGDLKSISCGSCPKSTAVDRSEPVKTKPLVQLGQPAAQESRSSEDR